MFESNSVASAITGNVRNLYERFPYPHYPLFAKPRWQDGYLGASKFAGKLFEDLEGHEAAIHSGRGQFVRDGRTILVAGAGEILPYILRKIEPSAHRLLYVDISAKSLARARFRLRGNFRPMQFIRSDINDFLRFQAPVTGPYNHIDIYGVLHHLANPSETIKLLSHHLSPRGTMRVMVYNSVARSWIHQLQKAFRLLKLSPFEKIDRDFCRDILNELQTTSETLKDRLTAMGKATLNNDARLVDTFFHVREANLNFKQWFDLFTDAGLKAYALLDRYGELDDLENPLWRVPDVDDLHERAMNGEFQNNLELYLCKANIPAHKVNGARYGYERSVRRFDLIPYYLKLPPAKWFAYPETEKIAFKTRLKLWFNFVEYTAKYKQSSFGELRRDLNIVQMQRLARVGAILPKQIDDKNLRKNLLYPLEQRQSFEGFKPQDWADNEKLEANLMTFLRGRNLYSPTLLIQIMRRFKAAASSERL